MIDEQFHPYAPSHPADCHDSGILELLSLCGRRMEEVMDELIQLAALLKQHNAITNEIARLIGRPAEMGHVGEYLAAKLFAIDLSPSASTKSIDGYFADGSLAQRSVNIKWYGKKDDKRG